MEKLWKIKQQLKNKNIIDVLLENRGLTTKTKISEFFNPPKPWEIKLIDQTQIKKALLRIKKAIKNQELIIVYGDYDADGICGTAILWETLHSQKANVLPFIPDRERHGYGLSKKGIDEITKNSKFQIPNSKLLIITVDNGIVANKAIDYAKKKGIDVIVTDHHQIKDLPNAQSIIWSDKVCGAAVAWMLAKELDPAIKTEFLDLACIATISDMMPLTGPNRSFAYFGLKELNQTKRLGLKALFEEAGLKQGLIESWQVGYIIGPRLNAMGRLESALDSLRLLCTKDNQRAQNLAVILGLTNKQRQEMTLKSFEHAKNGINTNKKLLFIAHESYSAGVIGLVAGKLVEHFYKPAIVISKNKDISKGSVRSVKGFNIIEYLRIFENQGYFEELGGHPMAAGFTVKNAMLAQVEKKLQESAREYIKDEWLQPQLLADCELNLDLVNDKLIKDIKKFAPFGQGNFQPNFVTRNVEITDCRQMGATGKHLRLCFKNGVKNLQAIAFGLGESGPKLLPGKKVDILYTVDENNWNGKTSIQLKIRDIKLF